jgi:hypothetical protein
VQYQVPVKIVILNNQYRGMVRQWQQMFYGRRYSHTDMTYAPDFVKIAEAYGATGLRASRPEELEAVLKKGLETPGVVVMDIRVEKEECVYPMVRPGASIADMELGVELPAAPSNGSRSGASANKSTYRHRTPASANTSSRDPIGTCSAWRRTITGFKVGPRFQARRTGFPTRPRSPSQIAVCPTPPSILADRPVLRNGTWPAEVFLHIAS